MVGCSSVRYVLSVAYQATSVLIEAGADRPRRRCPSGAATSVVAAAPSAGRRAGRRRQAGRTSRFSPAPRSCSSASGCAGASTQVQVAEQRGHAGPGRAGDTEMRRAARRAARPARPGRRPWRQRRAPSGATAGATSRLRVQRGRVRAAPGHHPTRARQVEPCGHGTDSRPTGDRVRRPVSRAAGDELGGGDAYAAGAACGAGDADPDHVRGPRRAALGTYLVRVRVDGAESLCSTNPPARRYDPAPKMTIP